MQLSLGTVGWLTTRALDGGYGVAFMDSLVTPPPVTQAVRNEVEKRT
jgi:hypothetical protein